MHQNYGAVHFYDYQRREYDQLLFDHIHLITTFPYGFEIGAEGGHCCNDR